jgi:hypothetical protein
MKYLRAHPDVRVIARDRDAAAINTRGVRRHRRARPLAPTQEPQRHLRAHRREPLGRLASDTASQRRRPARPLPPPSRPASQANRHSRVQRESAASAPASSRPPPTTSHAGSAPSTRRTTSPARAGRRSRSPSTSSSPPDRHDLPPTRHPTRLQPPLPHTLRSRSQPRRPASALARGLPLAPMPFT